MSKQARFFEDNFPIVNISHLQEIQIEHLLLLSFCYPWTTLVHWITSRLVWPLSPTTLSKSNFNKHLMNNVFQKRLEVLCVLCCEKLLECDTNSKDFTVIYIIKSVSGSTIYRVFLFDCPEDLLYVRFSGFLFFKFLFSRSFLFTCPQNWRFRMTFAVLIMFLVRGFLLFGFDFSDFFLVLMSFLIVGRRLLYLL